MRSSPAFTLIEILLVIAIIGICSIAFFSTYNSSRANQALTTSTSQFADMVRRARVYSTQSKNTSDIPAYPSSWGVKGSDERTFELWSHYTDVGGTARDRLEIIAQLDKQVEFENFHFDEIKFEQISGIRLSHGMAPIQEIVLRRKDNTVIKKQVQITKVGVVEIL